MTDRFFIETIDIFKEFDEVEAIALGGSRASGCFDADSDYDVYVYLNGGLSIEKRKQALSQTCGYMEIDNSYWETEDDCVLNSGVAIELIYRNTEDIRQDLRGTLEKHIARCGYTTCVCYNIFNSKIMYDPKGFYNGMVKEFTMPYPEQLRKNIVSKNRELLDGKIPSYLGQIEKAVKRNDVVSINHRTAEFLSSYFDILFAVNRTFHPGEKRLIELGKTLCKHLPVDFEANLRGLFAARDKAEMLSVMREIISNLDDLIKKHM